MLRSHRLVLIICEELPFDRLRAEGTLSKPRTFVHDAWLIFGRLVARLLLLLLLLHRGKRIGDRLSSLRHGQVDGPLSLHFW